MTRNLRVHGAYSKGILQDAAQVAEGRSHDVRWSCPDCGRSIGLTNKGEDWRCRSCTDKSRAVVMPRTPELLRGWAKTTREVLASQPAGSETACAELEQWARRWEREADELEGKR